MDDYQYSDTEQSELQERIATTLATVDTRRDEYGLGPAEYSDLADAALAVVQSHLNDVHRRAEHAEARVRELEQQHADAEDEHRQAHETETANTAAEIDRAEKAEAALARVRQLHHPDDLGECRACGESYDPCPTIREATDTPTETD